MKMAKNSSGDQGTNGASTIELQLDDVRSLIVERASALGFTYADLSRAVERNETYIHQFVFRGTPKHLSEEVRTLLAAKIGVTEDDLRGGPRGQQRRLSPAARVNSMTGDVAIRGDDRDIPVFTDSRPLSMKAPAAKVGRPRALDAVPGAFAIWVTRKHGGRLKPGDMIFVHPTQPPRVSDLVVVLKGEQILAIGDLLRQNDDSAMIQSDGAETKGERVPTHDARILKVVTIYLP
jgi:hypothetical protein